MKTSYIFTNGSEILESTSYLLKHIDDSDVMLNPNKYAFILTSAASFEGMLNDGIVVWAHNTFPKDAYKRHATAFLSMNLLKKLDALGYLLSSGNFITCNASTYYQIFSKLGKLRNEVAHSKDFFTETEIEFIEEIDGSRSFLLPQDVVEKSKKSVLHITKQECELISEALIHLKQVLNFEIDIELSNLFKPL